ncbi:four helix bundle protein [Arenimonas sp. MALMAid1274]|uniref:four helix bundle protein n=1 Tax=Arenimonas sp. MALMAid1274 TaxID=3411630 RepID=UPI003BA16867
MHYRNAVVWQKAMQLAEMACRSSKQLPSEERFGIRSQITRAAISVPSNVAEGWTRESRKEKAHFLAVAHGSLGELHSQILLCRRLGWLKPEEADSTIALAFEIGRMLTTLRRGLRKAQPAR